MSGFSFVYSLWMDRYLGFMINLSIKTAHLFPLLAALFLAAGFLVGEASGLIIYRFGGENLPDPPEAGSEGVEFISLSWSDLDAERGGQATELDMDGSAVGVLERNPSFNIAPGVEEHGGSHVRPHVNGKVFDGDRGTTWLADRYLCAEFLAYSLTCIDDFGTPGTANIFLGNPYLIDRVRIVSGLTDPGKTVQNIRIYIGLTSEMPSGVDVIGMAPPFVPWIIEVRDNREQVLDVAIPPHEEVDFLQVAVGEHNEDMEVQEVEIYTKGLVKKSTYISNIIAFDRPMAWGDLRWSGLRDTKAKVLIQTRSGYDDTPVVFWRFTGRGNEKIEVDHFEYGSLKGGEKAGITHDQANWTFWSAPYDFADSTGAPVLSASPRSHFQFKVDFLAQDDDGGRVDFLEFRASEPMATNLVGEVWPTEVRAGQQSDFTYFLRPTVRSEDVGFDQLEIQTSSIVNEVKQMRIGDVVVQHDVVEQNPHRLLVSFPRVEPRDSGVLVEVEFAAQVLRYGATFDAWVSDSHRALEVPQGVNAGDATDEYEGNRVSVATSVREQVLSRVRIEPAVFTPNGDGSNDRVAIVYNILEITGPAQVLVEVLDLSGRRVRRVYGGADGIGEYVRAWNGRDDAGQMVPPGVYLYRISVDADKEKVEKAGVLHAAY